MGLKKRVTVCWIRLSQVNAHSMIETIEIRNAIF